MVSLFRLKGRALQIGNASLLTLTFFTGITLICTVNLLPVIYIKGISPFFTDGFYPYEKIINLSFGLFAVLFVYSIFSAIRLGIKRFFLKRAQKKSARAEDIFFYFKIKSFFRCLFYSVKITAVRLMIFIFCVSPCAVCLAIVYRFSSYGVSALVCISLLITSLCLFLNGIIFYLSFFSSFFLCDYYFIEGTYVSFGHLLACSQKMMAKKKALLAKLRLSFSGWFILCLLLVPLPYVWSYYNQSLAVAAADFMKGKGA